MEIRLKSQQIRELEQNEMETQSFQLLSELNLKFKFEQDDLADYFVFDRKTVSIQYAKRIIYFIEIKNKNWSY